MTRRSIIVKSSIIHILPVKYPVASLLIKMVRDCWMLICLLLMLNGVQTVKVGMIQNVSLTPSDISTTMFSGTCEMCLCEMVNFNQAIVSLNCHTNNGTCDLFSSYSQSVTYRMQDEPAAIFYFLQLPSSLIASLLWPFDGSINDAFDLVTSVSVGNISYISPGITGRGSALVVNLSQYVSVSSSYLNLSWNSFTFEVWAYPFSLPNATSPDYSLIGQCLYYNTSNCLHIILRAEKTYFGFYGIDCQGNTILVINTWYHLAFVYDYSSKRQTTYVNGQVDCNQSANALQVPSGTSLTIGATFVTANRVPPRFNGYIDQVSYVNRAKNSSEILNDATLVVYYSFNGGSLLDSSSNGINATGVQVILINDSVLLNTNSSYLQAKAFVLLGTSNRSYSIALWINPSLTNGSTLIHLSVNESGADSVCWDMMGFDQQGQLISQTRYNGLTTLVGSLIPSNVWTYIVQTYSANDGLRVYVNGTFIIGTTPVIYQPITQPYIITLGSCLSGCGVCTNSSIVPTTYTGLIDEFRVYSRELSLIEIQTLAHR